MCKDPVIRAAVSVLKLEQSRTVTELPAWPADDYDPRDTLRPGQPRAQERMGAKPVADRRQGWARGIAYRTDGSTNERARSCGRRRYDQLKGLKCVSTSADQ
jgi:hypothetical protein